MITPRFSALFRPGTIAASPGMVSPPKELAELRGAEVMDCIALFVDMRTPRAFCRVACRRSHMESQLGVSDTVSGVGIPFFLRRAPRGIVVCFQ
jgi:hypothetical protein